MDSAQAGMDLRRWLAWVADRASVSAELLGAGLILLAGLVLAIVLARLFEGAAVRTARVLLTSSTRRDQQVRRVSRTLGRTVFWLVLVFTVMVATERLGMPIVTAWMGGIADYVPRILVAVLVVIGGLAIARTTGAASVRAARRSSVSNPRRVGRLVEVTVLAVTALVAVEALGIDIRFLQSAILVVLAGLLLAAALAFGLGARELVGDILACHYTQRLYRVGQVIRVEGQGSATIQGRILRVVPPCIVLDTPAGEVAVPARRITAGESILIERPPGAGPAGKA